MTEVSEISEEQPVERPDIDRYRDLLCRRHQYFLIPLLVGWLAVWGAGWVLPARYQSTTLILVEQPSMPKDYVAPNVSEDLQDRLQSITQQILSRTRLLSIIDKLHLYAGRRNQATADERVELMRKDINIEIVHGENQKDISGFKIAYSAGDPHVAQQVTGELTDLFIDENLKVRQQESQNTTTFIQNQLETARSILAEQEAKVREYEAQHEGELPAQQASNIQILNGMQSQLQSAQDALNSAKQQGVYFQALLQQYRALDATTGSVEGGPLGLPAIDQQLDQLRSKLTNLNSHYSDRYPDVRNLKSEIAKTEKLRDDLLAEAKNKGKGGQPSEGAAVASGPAGLAPNSSMLQLESQLQANQAEITNRERAVASLEAKVNMYQARLNDEPAREQELADLTRGYEQSKANYDELLKKKNASEMATSMEQMQQGERFRMLDPPSLPAKPAFPNRIKLCGIGLGVGLALGFLVAFGSEFMDGRLHNDQQIKEMLSVSVLCEIPEIVIASEERKGARRNALGWATAVMVAVTILGGSLFTYLHS
jgi:polysaccharide chain length determinant protein (PEP-CTERM system associated)